MSITNKYTTSWDKKMSSKICDLDYLASIIQREKARGKTVVHCHGVFDLLHPGHLRHLREAKRLGDILIVTITEDKMVKKGPGRPVFNERLRLESLAALEMVDYVALNRWDTAVNTIKLLKPHIYAKGPDYKNKTADLTGKIIDEAEAIKSVGGRIVFTDDIVFSSTQLLNKYFSVLPHDAEMFLREFKKRYSADQIIDILQSFQSTRTLVIGDAIIDEYCFAQAVGKPSKSSSISARYIRKEHYAGGALAVANHISGFCKEIHLVTCLGLENPEEEFISSRLKPNIYAKYFYREDAPTTIKQRFLDEFKLNKMFEISFMEDKPLPDDLERVVSDYLKSVINDFDLVVTADFGHGFINRRIIETLTTSSKFLALNVQANSENMGFNLVSKYPLADFISLDERELRLAGRSKYGDIQKLIKGLVSDMQAKMVAVTLGNNGSLVHEKGNGFSHVPVFTTNTVDTVGAGDAYLSVTSLLAERSTPNDLLGFVGNAVGALASQIVGNKNPVEPVLLYRFITTLLK